MDVQTSLQWRQRDDVGEAGALGAELIDGSLIEALSERRPSTTARAPPYRGFLAWLGEQDRESAEHFWR
ncbi:MAG: hypothetical protein ACHQO8_12645, partial [Vicinamibacterales bacterium]